MSTSRIKLLFVGIGGLLSAGLISIWLDAVRTSMIVEFGIIATNTIKTILVVALLSLGIITTGVALYSLISVAVKDSSKDRLKRSSLAYRAKTSGQKEIRDQLIIMKGVRPKLSEEIDECLDQLDSIVSQFGRFDQLIKSNDAEAVSGARVGLEEIEKTLCTNFKWVINSSIAAGDDDSPEIDSFYDQCISRIDRVIKANSRALEKGNQFLLEIADNISQIGSGNTAMLDAWIETIRAQNKQSLIGMEDDNT